MNESQLVSALYNIFYYSAVFLVPPLLVATAVAFIVGLLQAVTQIQEQTLPQTIKILVIGFVLIVFGSALTAPLYNASDEIFS
ncbi:MAG: flagellar biosynthetic protein FliQ, partial [Pseudomonadota bacterium]